MGTPTQGIQNLPEATTPRQKERLMRLPEVLRLVGVSRSTLYRWVKAGRFPPPVLLGPRAVAWWASQVYEWMANRPSARRLTGVGKGRN